MSILLALAFTKVVSSDTGGVEGEAFVVIGISEAAAEPDIRKILE